MKEYSKPNLKELGLLRLVTKFSGCPAGEVYIPGIGCTRGV
jgi:hypothetical protein